MSLTSLVKGKIIGTVVGKLAASEPRTTLIGASIGGITLMNVDWNKAVQGDPQQIGMAIAGLLIGIFGYFANHKNLQPPAPPAVTAGVKP